MHTKPSVSFKTVGCRLNQAETALMASRFAAAGYDIVPFGTACDVAVIHGCAVTRRAESDTRRLARGAKRLTSRPFVVIAGCAAEIGKDNIAKAAGADMIVPQRAKFNLPALLDDKFCAAVAAHPGKMTVPLHETIRAPVKVQDGCDFGCAYCVVPAARGAPASRPIKEVVGEVKRLAESGFREIILTGANLGCYSDARRRLVHLIEAVEKVDGIRRIRLSSIELTTGERAIVDHMAGSRKLCRHLHVPLQSGDDRILRAMGRRYSTDDFKRFAEYAANKMGLFALGTDVIVGFPGEDEDSFENTLQLVGDLPFGNVHVFSYSARPGTKAAALPGQVRGNVLKARTRRLLSLAGRKKADFAKSFVGRSVEVLVEEPGEPGTVCGWTREYVRATVPSQGLAPNAIVSARVISAEGGTAVLDMPTILLA